MRRVFKRAPVTHAQPPQKKGGSFFLLILLLLFSGWFVWTSLNPTLPQSSEPPRIYSNQCQDDLTLTFLSAISQATKSIDLIMFGLTDRSILRVLNEKSKQEIPVTITYDPSASLSLKKKIPLAKIFACKGSGLMHKKILILDEDLCFLGSANFTPTSLRMHDNLVLGFSDPKAAHFLQKTSGYLKTTIGGQRVEFWHLPDLKGKALQDVRHLLRSAKKSIQIALFTLTHPTLTDEIIAAQRRGIHVTLVLDRTSAFGASYKASQALLKAGVDVLLSQGSQLMHHKFAWIDEETLLMGSANWTKAAFTKNRDCLLALHHLDESQKSTLTSLWRRIYHTAERH